MAWIIFGYYAGAICIGLAGLAFAFVRFVLWLARSLKGGV